MLIKSSISETLALLKTINKGGLEGVINFPKQFKANKERERGLKNSPLLLKHHSFG
jgi:hypothetical protein